ncbi:hypothetical protein Anas_09188 [Armadillidium nasatum]|uniref:Uncharacterized protein n=1 Tax=Armadillidium nasatum TaxID=96803 RepID=A0A5N5SU26_9CRUS|nr:hypothetical protein Anas_09188 [Armadillidium nasatum]
MMVTVMLSDEKLMEETPQSDNICQVPILSGKKRSDSVAGVKDPELAPPASRQLKMGMGMQSGMGGSMDSMTSLSSSLSETVMVVLSRVRLRMEHLKTLKLLFIGDTRVNTLVRDSDKERYNIKVYTCEKYELKSICDKIDSILHLGVYKPNVLIVVALHNDIVHHSAINSSSDVMKLNKGFKINKTVEMVIQYNNKWKEIFPNLDIVWTVPAVPDFLRYNIVMWLDLMNNEILKRNLESEQVKYKQVAINLVNKFKEKDITYIDLNKITRYRGKRLKLFREVQDVPVVTFVDKRLTKDGVHPQTRMAERFLRMLSQLMKILNRKRNSNLYLNDSGLQTIYDSKDQEGMQLLWDNHVKEWDKYRKIPESYPEYDHHRQLWLYDLMQQGKGAKYSQLDWEKYFLEKLEQLCHTSWEEKQKIFLAEKKSLSSTTSTLSDSPIEESVANNNWKEPSKFEDSSDKDIYFITDTRISSSNSNNRMLSPSLELKEKENIYSSPMTSIPVVDTSSPSADESYNGIAGITFSLSKISDRLGALGVTLSAIHSKVVEDIRNGTNPFNSIDEDSKIILELIKSKILKLLRDCDESSRDHIQFQEALDNLERFFHLLQEQENDSDLFDSYGLEIESLLNATNGMDDKRVIGFLETVLAYKGHTDVSQDELKKIYLYLKQQENNLKLRS